MSKIVDVSGLDFKKMGGLIPAVVQDVASGTVLMLGFQNRDAVEKTNAIGLVTFFSRSKDRLWTKGETSGNGLKVVSASIDCDHDTVLYRVTAPAATCHTGSFSCFGGKNEASSNSAVWLDHLDGVIAQRLTSDDESSYTKQLMQSGINKVAQKVGEEGTEVVIAALAEDDQAHVGETADLLFHAMVLLQAKGLSLADVVAKLQERHK